VVRGRERAELPPAKASGDRDRAALHALELAGKGMGLLRRDEAQLLGGRHLLRGRGGGDRCSNWGCRGRGGDWCSSWVCGGLWGEDVIH